MVSERRVCGLLSIAVSSYRYQASDGNAELRGKIVELAREKPRYGYRRLHVLLQREGEAVNHKRVYRVYREAGLCLRRKKRKHCVRMQAPLRQHTAANQEWALDFVHDAIAAGRSIRVLSVVDAYTRQCLALEVDTSFASRRVTRVLDEIILRCGCPRSIRCDNGPELTSRHFLAWCLERKIELVHIQPGKPMQNGRVESFNGKLREECLRRAGSRTCSMPGARSGHGSGSTTSSARTVRWAIKPRRSSQRQQQVAVEKTRAQPARKTPMAFPTFPPLERRRVKL